MDITGVAIRPAEPGDSVAGVKPQWVASPASTEQTSAVLRAAAAEGLAVVPRGSGRRLDWGRPPERCDLILDLSGMDQVLEHAAGDLVARVQAGATMGHVAEVLARAGQRISLDIPPESTIGGVIADGLAGSLRLRFGGPRDLLIGITVVRADGVVARSGGRVVKNVAGYDLGKLFAGSRGTLGVITEATFRLHPIPAASEWVTTTLPMGVDDASLPIEGHPRVIDAPGGLGGLGGVVGAAANSALLPSAVEVFRGEAGAPWEIGALLEGTAEGVAARAEELAGLLRDGVRRYVSRISYRSTVVRVSFWLSALDGVVAAIDEAAAETGVRPVLGGPAGAGVLDVSFDGDPGAFVAALRTRLAGNRGSVTVLTPFAGDVLGDVPGLALMRAVKDQFDPEHRMAPGRLAEGILHVRGSAGGRQRLRALRLLPARVPDLPAVGRGDGLAARAHPPDHPGAGRRAADRRGGVALRPLSRLHGLYDRVPVRRPVRPAHRGRAGVDGHGGHDQGAADAGGDLLGVPLPPADAGPHRAAANAAADRAGQPAG